MNKTLLSYLLIIGICGVAGVGSGVILKRTLGPIDEMYPPGFDPSEFSANIEEIYGKYETLSNKTYDGVANSVNPKFSNSDIANIVLENYRRNENNYSLGIGVADAGIVAQTIRSAQIKKGNTYFEEQISYSSMVSVANRSIQEGKDGGVDLYGGSASGPETASYPEGPTQKFDRAGYKSYLGKSLDEMFIYIISDKTTTKSSVSKKGDDVELYLELNPNISTFNYKIQMQNISGLANLPPFSEVKLTYTFSKDLELKHLHVDETYVATKSGIPYPAKTHNLIEYYYYSNDASRDIPKSNEAINYSQEA